MNARGAAKLLALLLVLFSLTAGFVLRPASAVVCSRCLLAGDVEGSGIIPDPTELIFNGTFRGIEQAGDTVRQVTYTAHMKAQIVTSGSERVGEGVLELRGAGRGVAYVIPVEIAAVEGASVFSITLASDDSAGFSPDVVHLVDDDQLTVANVESARMVGSIKESRASAKEFTVAGPASFER